jgi:hypothetical protein
VTTTTTTRTTTTNRLRRWRTADGAGDHRRRAPCRMRSFCGCSISSSEHRWPGQSALILLKLLRSNVPCSSTSLGPSR